MKSTLPASNKQRAYSGAAYGSGETRSICGDLPLSGVAAGLPLLAAPVVSDLGMLHAEAPDH